MPMSFKPAEKVSRSSGVAFLKLIFSSRRYDRSLSRSARYASTVLSDSDFSSLRYCLYLIIILFFFINGFFSDVFILFRIFAPILTANVLKNSRVCSDENTNNQWPEH